MIRAATPADIPEILAIWNPLIRDSMVTFNATEKTEADLAQTLKDKSASGLPFFVAETPDSIAGFATYGQFRAGIGYAKSFEHTIILAESARGKGIGRALMAAIETHARDAGGHVLFAGVSGGNPEGRDFHAALGYEMAAILPEVGYKFGRYWDLVLMRKFLT